jgi:hypothetical protein
MNLTTTTPTGLITMTSPELVDFINASRAPGEAELRHDSFMAKVPKVLGEAAPKFCGTGFYYNATGGRVPRAIYTFPKREACLMAMSYSYELQARVFDRMTELESPQGQEIRVPTSFREALLLAASQQEEIERLSIENAVLALTPPLVSSRTWEAERPPLWSPPWCCAPLRGYCFDT